MRIKITAGGIFGADGELPIGHEMVVEKAPEGWKGRYIDLDEHQPAGDRDANGDTPDMAALRKQFNAVHGKQGDALKAAEGKVTELTGTVTDLNAKLEAANGKVTELQASVQDRDAQITALKKQVPETDIDKMTVPELRAFLAYRDVKWDGSKDKKDDLVTLAKAAA